MIHKLFTLRAWSIPEVDQNLGELHWRTSSFHQEWFIVKSSLIKYFNSLWFSHTVRRKVQWSDHPLENGKKIRQQATFFSKRHQLWPQSVRFDFRSFLNVFKRKKLGFFEFEKNQKQEKMGLWRPHFVFPFLSRKMLPKYSHFFNFSDETFTADVCA